MKHASNIIQYIAIGSRRGDKKNILKIFLVWSRQIVYYEKL